jgi:hypothetical protein
MSFQHASWCPVNTDMTLVVCCVYLTEGVWARSQANACGIGCGESDIGTVFFCPRDLLWFSPSQSHASKVACLYIIRLPSALSDVSSLPHNNRSSSLL